MSFAIIVVSKVDEEIFYTKCADRANKGCQRKLSHVGVPVLTYLFPVKIHTFLQVSSDNGNLAVYRQSM